MIVVSSAFPSFRLDAVGIARAAAKRYPEVR
jgi:hypothetical protein